MSGLASAEAVPLDNSLKTPTLAGADYVYPVIQLENIANQNLAPYVDRNLLCLGVGKLSENPLRRHLGFLKMSRNRSVRRKRFCSTRPS